MQNVTKFLFLILLIGSLISFSSCGGGEDQPCDKADPTSDCYETPYDHSGFITEDETWDANGIHILKDRVVVIEGVTLTIEPGAIIKGEAGAGVNATSLVIARGAKINAAGTATDPIIFTSIADEIALGEIAGTNLDAESAKGFWGGVMILGNAPTSPKTGNTEQIEGIPASVDEGNYGGNDAEDNSGIFTYVSIRFGGTNIGEGNEINGLTLAGVGSGTTIHHIEVVGNVDDGIECFGGNVNIEDALVMFQGDDAYDLDQAYAGTIDNFIYIGGADSDHGLEIDGPEGSENSGGQFTLRNGSLKGNAAQGEFADFRSGAQGNVDGLYFFGFNQDADIELDDDATSDNYTTGSLTLTNLKFNASAWALNTDREPDGGTTTWEEVTDLFTDNSDSGDQEAADTKFEGDSNALVTSKEGGADVSEFTGWTLADSEGRLTDF